jgi:ABC-type uncharacterized transport system involved in gliding motility auxiliary subunit
VHDLFWFGGWLIAVGILFVGALGLPSLCFRRRTIVARNIAASLSVIAMLAVAVLANTALTRHDQHFDFTFERVFTPDSSALDVVKGLTRSIELTYFYRADDPDGIRARHMVELLAKENPLLQVKTIDPDRHPSLAQTAGVKFYNAALLEAEGRQIVVHSTDEREIALGIQKILREHIVTLCFMQGHGEYASTNYEFHTHIEELGGGDAGHSHGGDTSVVETTAHGMGRFRTSLEALGYDVREIVPATDGVIDASCNVVIDGGPRTPYSEIEAKALERYLHLGGAALLLYDLEFRPIASLDDVLRRIGVKLTNKVVADSNQHYAGDPEMVAVTSYEPHPATRGLSLAFFPGVRALEQTTTIAGTSVSRLFSSSNDSTSAHMIADHPHSETHISHSHSHDPAPSEHILAIASEGRLDAQSPGTFRVIVVGDSDFVSNSFYPYMSNNRLALALVRWLALEADQVPVAARIPMRRTVELNKEQQRIIFLLLVITLPLAVAMLGFFVWWKRR